MHHACKVGFMANSTEKNSRCAMSQLLCIVLPFLWKWPPGKQVKFPSTSHFSCLILFYFPDGSCSTEITESPNIAAIIGMDIKFHCQYNIPGGNYDSVYWYLQRANQNSSTSTIPFKAPRNPSITNSLWRAVLQYPNH